MTGWHPGLRRLVANSDPGTVRQFEFTAAARVRPWPGGRVTLLGDAIHCMPPVGGMGGALGAYQEELPARGFTTVRAVRLYTAMAISRSPLARATARGFFRLCGAVGPLRRAVFDD